MLNRAHATLVAGCDFVSQRQWEVSHARTLPCPWTQGVHNRLLANYLRELDRFLCVLLEEAALSLGGPDHDARRFARLRKTSDKLKLVEHMIGMPSRHDARLGAIRRIATRLRRPGTICQPSHAKDISLACDVSLETPLALQSIARFYRDLGDDLMKALHKVGKDILYPMG